MTCWSESLGLWQGELSFLILLFTHLHHTQVGQTEWRWSPSVHPAARLRPDPQQREVQEYVPQGRKARSHTRDLHVCRLRERQDGLLSGFQNTLFNSDPPVWLKTLVNPKWAEMYHSPPPSYIPRAMLSKQTCWPSNDFHVREIQEVL